MSWSPANAYQPDHTSKVARYRHGAKALISSDAAVLLVKERHADGTPFWTLPGGGIAPGETLVEALYRELREELCCRDVVIGAQSGNLWYANHSADGLVSKYTVFDCQTLSEPQPNLKEGVTEYRWVRPGTIPSRTLPQVRAICW
jgi:8-oxo-dGTP diphosphatase